ncbi:acetoacetate decarboxylase family protein [Phormidium tenue FACHB-886]|nr:acetoacetate decarboxylase family protein [Phormidium tenue FACHB-886]
MTYPQPPWTLQGYGLQTVQLIDIDSIRSQIPPQLNIVPVLPGKTAGGIYAAAYGTGSTLLYNELIVAAALVQHAGRIGAWISHIYVDNADSVAGGREIWGLPKENAQFSWEMGDRPSVQVRQGEQLLCHLSRQWAVPGWQQAFTVPVFSLLNQQLIQFNGQTDFKFYLAGVEVQIPSGSPLAQLKMAPPWLNFYFNPLQLVAEAPYFVKQ